MKSRVSVHGDHLSCSLEDYIVGCLRYLAGEQDKAEPDTALMALLSDGVRLARRRDPDRVTLLDQALRRRMCSLFTAQSHGQCDVTICFFTEDEARAFHQQVVGAPTA